MERAAASGGGTPDRRTLLAGGAAGGLGISVLALPGAAAAMSASHALAASSFQSVAVAGATESLPPFGDERFTAGVRVDASTVLFGTDLGRLFTGTIGSSPTTRVTTGVLSVSPFGEAIRSLAVIGGRLFATSDTALRHSSSSGSGLDVATGTVSSPALLATTTSRLLVVTDDLAPEGMLVREVTTPGATTPTIGTPETTPATAWRLDASTVGAGFIGADHTATCAVTRGEVLYVGTTQGSGPGWLIRLDFSGGGAPAISGVPMTLPAADHRRVAGIALNTAGDRALVTTMRWSTRRLAVLPVTLGTTMSLTGGEAVLSTSSDVEPGPTITDGVYSYVAEGQGGFVRTVHKVRMSDLLIVGSVNLNSPAIYLGSLGNVGAAVADGSLGFYAVTGEKNGDPEQFLVNVHTVQLDGVA